MYVTQVNVLHKDAIIHYFLRDQDVPTVLNKLTQEGLNQLRAIMKLFQEQASYTQQLPLLISSDTDQNWHITITSQLETKR